ncbi:MAG: uracil-DNA glycosylase family protein [archaeon]
MNPTGRNVSSEKKWKGIRAPWIGTKQVWNLLEKLNLINTNIVEEINSKKPSEWTAEFAQKVYENIASNSVYITNLSKATQIDARPLTNNIFREYFGLFRKEISLTNPKIIISFGNQVSSIILNKPISVSKYRKRYELLEIENKQYRVYPVFYPVGQGTPNIKFAKQDIKWILKNMEKVM